MQFNFGHMASGLLFAGVLAAASSAAAAPADVRTRVQIGPRGHVRATVRPVDRFHRVPPEIRLHGFRGPGVRVRVNTFRPFIGARITRFSPRVRATWVRGRWWHGRHAGRFGWWWFAGGSWFFYPAPIYPYPDYVSQTYYDEPGADYGNYWYYCRDPRGYYPYVQHCNGPWEPVPTQPEAAPAYGPGGYGAQNQGAAPGYGPGGYGAQDQQYENGGGPDQDEMGPDEGGPPDEAGPPDQGPPDEEGPPDQGPPDEGPPDDNGPPPRS
jgi:hypothetical protein